MSKEEALNLFVQNRILPVAWRARGQDRGLPILDAGRCLPPPPAAGASFLAALPYAVPRRRFLE